MVQDLLWHSVRCWVARRDDIRSRRTGVVGAGIRCRPLRSVHNLLCCHRSSHVLSLLCLRELLLLGVRVSCMSLVSPFGLGCWSRSCTFRSARRSRRRVLLVHVHFQAATGTRCYRGFDPHRGQRRQPERGSAAKRTEHVPRGTAFRAGRRAPRGVTRFTPGHCCIPVRRRALRFRALWTDAWQLRLGADGWGLTPGS